MVEQNSLKLMDDDLVFKLYEIDAGFSQPFFIVATAPDDALDRTSFDTRNCDEVKIKLVASCSKKKPQLYFSQEAQRELLRLHKEEK